MAPRCTFQEYCRYLGNGYWRRFSALLRNRGGGRAVLHRSESPPPTPGASEEAEATALPFLLASICIFYLQFNLCAIKKLGDDILCAWQLCSDACKKLREWDCAKKQMTHKARSLQLHWMILACHILQIYDQGRWGQSPHGNELLHWQDSLNATRFEVCRG